MSTIRPFRAVRPKEGYEQEIAALPYDVYTREQAKEAVKDKPYSFLRIDRAETELPDSVDTYDDRVYEKARELYDEFKEKGLFVKDHEPSLYLYELTMDGRVQTGIVAATLVDEYRKHIIKKHEETRLNKVEDRVKHIEALEANTGPTYLTYKARPEIKEIVSKVKEEPSLFDFTTEDNIRHRGWRISDKETIESLSSAFEDIDSLYIADGHHRTESAIRVRDQAKTETPSEMDYFLSVIFPDDELKILPYNRVIHDLGELSKKAFLERIQSDFEITPSREPVEPTENHTFGMLLGDKWYKLRLKTKPNEGLLGSLDVQILYDKILKPVLGIEDLRTDQRISFIAGIEGTEGLERRIAEGEALAFSLRPTTFDEIYRVADEQGIMPPKSTWFEPKLRSGLFIHEFI